MKSALVIGATRGIGRQIALTFAKNGYQVGVAAKTTESTPELPNSIYTVTDEIIAAGGKAAPFVCNVRDEKQLQKTLSDCRDQFGGLDVAIYNAGAIAWQQVIETPVKRFDLMHEVNLRGSYAMVQDVLPYFLERGSGRMILVCPPIYNRFFRGKVTYSLSKVGMTVLVHGLGYELKDTGVAISGIWPAKAIESHVTVKMGTPKRLMRKPTIFADACLKIAQETNPELINGRVLIDEDFLREKGVTDFAEYRSDPDIEPPRMLPEKFPSLLVEEEDAPPLSKL